MSGSSTPQIPRRERPRSSKSFVTAFRGVSVSTPIRDIQVRGPTPRGALGARALDVELQKALDPAPPARVEKFGAIFAPGDTLVQTENDYDRDVFNGDLGTVTRIDDDEAFLVASFDGREVSYPFGELDALAPAYATTIHKSQSPAVVIALATRHYAMLARNLVCEDPSDPGGGLAPRRAFMMNTNEIEPRENARHDRLVGERQPRRSGALGTPSGRRWPAGRSTGPGNRAPPPGAGGLVGPPSPGRRRGLASARRAPHRHRNPRAGTGNRPASPRLVLRSRRREKRIRHPTAPIVRSAGRVAWRRVGLRRGPPRRPARPPSTRRRDRRGSAAAMAQILFRARGGPLENGLQEMSRNGTLWNLVKPLPFARSPLKLHSHAHRRVRRQSWTSAIRCARSPGAISGW
ncbi:ATP-dependent+RecD-like+DNA+helicase [Methylocapsa aurea]